MSAEVRALLRLSCFQCQVRFSGRIVRSAGDLSPREGGIPFTRRAMNYPGYSGSAP